MQDKMENPIPRIDSRPPRPQSLKELYELVVKICPNDNHNEDNFFDFIIKALKRDPIRNSSKRSNVEAQGLNFILERNLPINDFWYAADKYLESLSVTEEEISKFDMIVNDGFKE